MTEKPPSSPVVKRKYLIATILFIFGAYQSITLGFRLIHNKSPLVGYFFLLVALCSAVAAGVCILKLSQDSNDKE